MCPVSGSRSDDIFSNFRLFPAAALRVAAFRVTAPESISNMTARNVRWIIVCIMIGGQVNAAGPSVMFRSCRSGAWSAPTTWEAGSVPTDGARVQVRVGHTVTYDLESARAIRFIHVAGVLTFAADRNTRLDVGLLKIEQGENASEDGFDCDAHATQVDPAMPRPALLVGTPERPIGAEWKAHNPARLV